MDRPKIAILIPARRNEFGISDKLLNKDDGFTPTIRRVYDICKSNGLDTYVVTDSESIIGICPNSLLIRDNIVVNDLELCSLVSNKLAYEWFIIIKGDMLDVNEVLINALVTKSYSIDRVITLHRENKTSINDNSVKLLATGSRLHWFTRNSMDYAKKHIEVYSMPKNILESYKHLPVHEAERYEKLEQLRWLENNVKVLSFNIDYEVNLGNTNSIIYTDKSISTGNIPRNAIVNINTNLP